MQLTPDFYNFDIYQVDTATTWKKDIEDNKERPVLVLLETTSEVELQLLQKILTAIDLNMEKDCCILKHAGALQFKDLKTAFPNLEKLLVFGRGPSDLGLHLALPPYRLTPFQDVQLLFVDALNIIAADRQGEKKRLWLQLQWLQKP